MHKYVVGGAVRDYIMGVEPKDFDWVVTGSTPEEMLSLGFKQVGADFPVFLDEAGREHALARTEKKSGNGYMGFITNHDPNVTIEDDLARRDLTINSIAMDEDDRLIDPFNGQADIKNKILRHTTEAFADDPVRVLRLARFAARYGHEWTVDPSTIDLCRKMVESGELNHLTKERVWKELEKALNEKEPGRFFGVLEECGALRVVFPHMGEDFPDFISHAEAKLNFCILVKCSSDQDAFINDLGVVPTEYMRFFRVYEVFYKVPGSLITSSIVDMFYEADAYRDSETFLEVLDALATQFENDWVTEMLSNTRQIGFAQLSECQQQNLKGPEIAAAIKEVRNNWVLIHG